MTRICRFTPLNFEPLEDRTVPANVDIHAGTTIRMIPQDFFGTNLGWWDHQVATPQTQQMVRDAGLMVLRQPGGSATDDWHFNIPMFANDTIADFNRLTAGVGAQGVITVNYGTGSPQEAAAWLAYLNAQPTDTTLIGLGPQYNETTKNWETKDWKTTGYWAALRAATPLAADDGLNFLRAGRAEPFGIRYFEVGNEIYGPWETDQHTAPHDPATYVAFAKQFAAYAALISPGVKIGLGVQGYQGEFIAGAGNWADKILAQCAAQGYLPDFLADHNYMFHDPADVSDDALLLHTANDPGFDTFEGRADWVGRSAGYRNLIQTHLGDLGGHVELLCTEFNSATIDHAPKQTSNLVNGLFIADAIGGILQTEYDQALVWDLRNGYDTDPAVNTPTPTYGWRPGGDEGLIGSDYVVPTGTPKPPFTGPYVPYPSYFGAQLAGLFARPGDAVVQAVSNDPKLSVYAVHRADGHLALLVINKNAASDLAGAFQIDGFIPSGAAEFWQYGKTQDGAQKASADGASALLHFTNSLPHDAGSLSVTFPAYSMTLLDLAPSTATSPPMVPPSSPPTVPPTASPPTVLPPAASAPLPVLIAGTPDGTAQLFAATSGQYQPGDMLKFFPGSAVIVRVATADVTGDGIPDFIGVTGSGVQNQLTILDGQTRQAIVSFSPFESSFTGGLFVIAADMDGDGKAEVVVSPDQSGGPVVVIYSGAKLGAHETGDPAQIVRFFGIDDPAFRGGARVALGDVNGDGKPDLVVAAGFGGGPRVALFDGKDIVAGSSTPHRLMADFFAFEDGLRNGAFAAAGDLDGDGAADPAFGGGPGGAPRVRVFSGAGLLAAGSFRTLDDVASTAQMANFFAGDTNRRGGVHLTLRDADGDGQADLTTGSGAGDPSDVRVYKSRTLLAGASSPDQDLDPFAGAILSNGVFVG